MRTGTYDTREKSLVRCDHQKSNHLSRINQSSQSDSVEQNEFAGTYKQVTNVPTYEFYASYLPFKIIKREGEERERRQREIR